METLKFKTNINCSGCVAKVTPHLDENPSIMEWNVDTNNPGKVLTITTDQLSEDELRTIVQKAGFKAERLD